VINWPPLVWIIVIILTIDNIWNADVSFSNSMIIHQLDSEVVYQVIQREKYRNKR
jgi:hypothetical protein